MRKSLACVVAAVLSFTASAASAAFDYSWAADNRVITTSSIDIWSGYGTTSMSVVGGSVFAGSSVWVTTDDIFVADHIAASQVMIEDGIIYGNVSANELELFANTTSNYLIYGDAQVGKTSLIGYGNASDYINGNLTNNDFDLAAHNANKQQYANEILAMSETLSGFAANGTATRQADAVTLVGTGTDDLQVFNLDNMATTVAFENILAGTDILINVNIDNGLEASNLTPIVEAMAGLDNHIVFNVVQGAVELINVDFKGDIIGYGTDLYLTNALIEGYVFAANITLDGDNVIMAVPEPSEYMLLLMGLVLVGFIARRRDINS